MVRATLEAEDETQPLPFVDTLSTRDTKAGLAGLRTMLGTTLTAADYYKRRVSSAVRLDEVRRPRATDFRAGRQSPDGGRRDAQTDSGVQELTDLPGLPVDDAGSGDGSTVPGVSVCSGPGCGRRIGRDLWGRKPNG